MESFEIDTRTMYELVYFANKDRQKVMPFWSGLRMINGQIRRSIFSSAIDSIRVSDYGRSVSSVACE